ncbi:MAG: WYL domain-containing protein, partial [Rhodospirillales bacterium]
LRLAYRDADGKATERTIRPLGLWFWGKVWTLVAWCELRNDFRVFRLDRIDAMADAGDPFKPERGKTLADFYRTMESCPPGAMP